jgi:hypothetical protein
MLRARPTRPGTAALAAALVVGALLAGCGGGDEPSASAPSTGPEAATTTRVAPPTTTDAAPSTTTEAAPPSTTPDLRAERRAFPGLLPLRQVPQAVSQEADPRAERVAEAWFDLVRRGEDERAAELMSDGARFANVVVLKLPSRAARVEAAGSLPCGATPTSVGGGANGYVVLSLRLTDKAGSPPCDGAGSPVAVAVHVTGGRIDDWVRIGADDAPVNRGAPV